MKAIARRDNSRSLRDDQRVRWGCGDEWRDRSGTAFEEIEAVAVGSAAGDGAPLGAAKPGVVDLVAGERVVGDDGREVDEDELAVGGLALGE